MPTLCCGCPASNSCKHPRNCRPRLSAMNRWWSWRRMPAKPRRCLIIWKAISPAASIRTPAAATTRCTHSSPSTCVREVGRLLNDKMPTGVAVSPAMNHGGPYPATGHPGFTAVGIPAALRRFAMLACYDNVRPARLPGLLQDKNSPVRRGGSSTALGRRRTSQTNQLILTPCCTRKSCRCGRSRIANGDATLSHDSPRCGIWPASSGPRRRASLR